jgi:hypothetical protein
MHPSKFGRVRTQSLWYLLTAAAGLLLLVDLTRSSIELQKLVAFESTFERLFQLIEHDGVQKGGAGFVSNCLRLFANLVRQNTTNQTLFRESGCVPKLSALLKSAYDTADAEKTGGQHNPERLDCVLGVLVLIRTFLVSGVVDTKVNQRTFERHGILQQVLDLAVTAAADPTVRVEVCLIDVTIQKLTVLGAVHLCRYHSGELRDTGQVPSNAGVGTARVQRPTA